jgi:hypothetical protein
MREATLTLREERYRAASLDRLARMTPRARRAWLTFALGAAATGGVPLVPAMLLIGPPALAALGVVIGTGAAIGAVWRHVSPRTLVSQTELQRLEEEVDDLVRALPMPLAPIAPLTGPDVVTREGELRGDAGVDLLGGDALALRIRRGDRRCPLDDAWIGETGPWTLSTADHDEVSISTSDGVRLDAEGTARTIEALDPRQLEFLRARGQSAYEGDALSVDVASLHSGMRVRITGRRTLRNVADGYRGTKTAESLVGPIVIAWSTAEQRR